LVHVVPNFVYAALTFGEHRDQHVYAYTSDVFNYSLLCFLFLHHNFQSKLFSDLVGIDFPDRQNRFQLISNILSVVYHHRIFVVIWNNELSTVSSVSSLHPSAVWFEREVWDLFGVHFYNNADLRRILTDYSFNGHPLRKDFPLSGFVELFYNYKVDSVVYREVSLVQEYRNFQLSSPWEYLANS